MGKTETLQTYQTEEHNHVPSKTEFFVLGSDLAL